MLVLVPTLSWTSSRVVKSEPHHYISKLWVHSCVQKDKAILWQTRSMVGHQGLKMSSMNYLLCLYLPRLWIMMADSEVCRTISPQAVLVFWQTCAFYKHNFALMVERSIAFFKKNKTKKSILKKLISSRYLVHNGTHKALLLFYLFNPTHHCYRPKCLKESLIYGTRGAKGLHLSKVQFAIHTIYRQIDILTVLVLIFISKLMLSSPDCWSIPT